MQSSAAKLNHLAGSTGTAMVHFVHIRGLSMGFRIGRVLAYRQAPSPANKLLLVHTQYTLWSSTKALTHGRLL